MRPILRAVKIQTAKGWPIISALVWVLVGLVLLLLPFKVLSHGFLPPDDALRYAAKAVSGKTWQEIIIMRPDITIDHNPGWNGFMSLLHRVTGWDVGMLIAFPVVVMFLVFAAAPLPWFRRPEAWLISLCVVMLVFPYFAVRAFVGRPFFLTMAVMLVLFCLWGRRNFEGSGKPGETSEGNLKDPRRPWALWGVTVILMALSTWVHGAWYLLVLMPAVYFPAGEWRKGLELTGCWIAGTILGALATMEPWTWLQQTVLIPFMALGENPPVNALVTEFQPFTGGYPALILVAIVLVWRKFAGRPLAALWRDPVLWMAVVGWVLGWRVFRFWLDWGLPALALWLARQLEELIVTKMPLDSWRRVVVTCATLFVLLAFVVDDSDGRWSQYGQFDPLNASRPEHAEWLPEPGGILYAVNLSVFYETFFTNPHGQWRYALGFEPSFMLAENRAVYLELWRTLNAIRACAPWVQKMTPADRMVLVSGPQPRPAIAGLEWNYTATNTWVGRLPKFRNILTPLPEAAVPPR